MSAKKAAAAIGASFGSRLAISDAGLSTTARRTRLNSKHVAQGQLPRQRHHGELLRYLDIRTFLLEPLRQCRAATKRHPPLHPLLQSRSHKDQIKRLESGAVPYLGIVNLARVLLYGVSSRSEL